MAKKKKSNAALRSVLMTLCILLGLVLAMLTAGTVYAEYLLDQVNYVDSKTPQETLSQEEIEQIDNSYTEDEDEEFTGPEVDESDINLGTAPVEQIGGENIVNIMLIGADYYQSDRPRSDSIILCTFNKTKNTITMTSFLRDMYVRIPGYQNNRINAAYNYGGMQLLSSTMKENFGVQVDGTVEIDFSHFEELIDLLGGIELELTAAEAKYLNYWQWDEPTLYEGVNVLNGAQALEHARNRTSGGSGDFNRSNRQRVVLSTLLNEYRNSSLTELLGMMDNILPMVTTDMTKDEIVGYVKDFFPMLAGCEIVMQRIPVDGGYYQARIREMAVLVPDMDMNIAALAEILSEGTEEGVG